MLYCVNFYGRCFIRVYEDKMPVIKVCTVQYYPIIIKTRKICGVLYIDMCILYSFPFLTVIQSIPYTSI